MTTTILCLTANPTEQTRLRLDEEVREISKQLRDGTHRHAFRLEQEHAVQVGDLSSHFMRHTPAIVHFSGHGSERGEIFLEDVSGKAQAVSVRALARLFSVLRETRCVVLNACYVGRQADAIAESVDCVVGMSNTISDRAAIAFSTEFYRALSFGKDVEQAFELGKVGIDVRGLAGSDLPQLHVRSGVAAQNVVITSKATVKPVSERFTGQLSPDERRELVDYLVQRFQGNGRKTIVQSALHGSKVLHSINWSGNAMDFTNHLVEVLLPFGMIETGEHGLVAVLKEIRRHHVGPNHYPTIDRLVDLLNRKAGS